MKILQNAFQAFVLRSHVLVTCEDVPQKFDVLFRNNGSMSGRNMRKSKSKMKLKMKLAQMLLLLELLLELLLMLLLLLPLLQPP